VLLKQQIDTYITELCMPFNIFKVAANQAQNLITQRDNEEHREELKGDHRYF